MTGLCVVGWVVAVLALALWHLQARAWRVSTLTRAEHTARCCHEVRGPLTAALMALHALGGRRPTPGIVEVLESELRRAARCLEDLQDAPDGSWTEDELETVDLIVHGEMQVDALDCLALELGRRVRFRSELEEAWVRADPVRVTQVLANLVHNALEHGEGEVVVAVREVGRAYALEVSDEGHGLGAPLSELIGRRRGGEGRRGRGLAIAAEMADRAGGRLRTAPSPRGACVVLELPADDLALGGLL